MHTLQTVIHANRRTGRCHASRICGRLGHARPIVTRQVLDLFWRDATHRRHPLGWPLQSPLAQLVPAQGVALQVVMIEPVVLNQFVHQPQRQRTVSAGQQGNVLVAFVCGLGLAWVNTDQLGPQALGLVGIAPEMQVAGNRIAAPDQDQLGLRKNSTRIPSLPPRVCTSPSPPAAAQIVRSSSEAPSLLKNRAAMLSPCTKPMVPA